MSNEDSLKVTEQEDGTFLVEWDANDPVWSMFNDLPEEELTKFFSDAIESYAKTILENEDVSIHDDGSA